MQIKTTCNILLLLLLLLALCVIGYDYTCGHKFEEVMILENCPICESFHATEKVEVILFALLMAGILVVIGTVLPAFFTAPSFLYQTLFALRAPPTIPSNMH
jgi:nitric oxide reductase large subunit